MVIFRFSASLFPAKRGPVVEHPFFQSIKDSGYGWQSRPEDVRAIHNGIRALWTVDAGKYRRLLASGSPGSGEFHHTPCHRHLISHRNRNCFVRSESSAGRLADSSGRHRLHRGCSRLSGTLRLRGEAVRRIRSPGRIDPDAATGPPMARHSTGRGGLTE